MRSSFQNPYSNSYTHDLLSLGHEQYGDNTFLTQSLIHGQGERKVKKGTLAAQHVHTSTSLANQPVIKTLEFRKKVFNSDLSIWHKTKWAENQQYFAACTGWRPNVPDVTLHAVIGDQDGHGPVLGVAHFRCSRHVRFGIGDALNKPGEVTWEEMRNVSRMLAKSNYEWQYTEMLEWNDIKDNIHPQIRRFKWQRTKTPDDGVENKLSLRNYRLTDQDSERVVAVFVARTLGNVRNRGEVRLFEELRPKVEAAVVLTCASILEKLNRD
ncbi:hypothetical protein H2200_010712 [Cladophialophora chaetospira]|uniref:Uncharacterized protein n=1 Tax=Cladophialophora chaetospira TaxID=386627 RepID=A0AA39CDS7_9EURO|nr:hypothetical protein H2200_010712 [Cladophialophora chaetospira]